MAILSQIKNTWKSLAVSVNITYRVNNCSMYTMAKYSCIGFLVMVGWYA